MRIGDDLGIIVTSSGEQGTEAMTGYLCADHRFFLYFFFQIVM